MTLIVSSVDFSRFGLKLLWNGAKQQLIGRRVSGVDGPDGDRRAERHPRELSPSESTRATTAPWGLAAGMESGVRTPGTFAALRRWGSQEPPRVSPGRSMRTAPTPRGPALGVDEGSRDPRGCCSLYR